MPAKKPKTKTVAQIAIAGLKRGKTNADVLASVRKAHPHSTISLATVNWYRNRLRDKKGTKIASDRETRRKRA